MAEPAEPLPLVRIDAPAQRVWLGEDEIHLPPIPYKLLAILTASAGRVVGHRDLTEHAWGPGWNPSAATVSMQMRWLRAAVGEDATCPRYVVNVRGVGYRFEADRLDPASVFAAAPAAVPDGLGERLDRIEAALYELRDLILLDRQTAPTAPGGGHG